VTLEVSPQHVPSTYIHALAHKYMHTYTYLAGGLGGLAAARTTKGELGGMRDANEPNEVDANADDDDDDDDDDDIEGTV
jgi:hypothetical protein